MRRWATLQRPLVRPLVRLLVLVLALLSGLASQAWAAKYLSVDQVEQLLVQLHGKPDGKVAAELGDIQLTQRVSSARLAHWETEFAGSRAREELLKLADMSAFLSPPAADVVTDPRPEVKTQLQILSLAVEYVGKTIPRLPDFYAMRETTHFEGISPAGYLLGEGETTLESTGAYNRTVTYHDGEEIPFETVGKRDKEPALGLTTNGEFGPILVTILRDALGNKIAFLRWERGQNGSTAVFGYTVPDKGSHFTVDTRIGNWAQTERPAYHGEIEIDPASGEIERLSEIADMASLESASIEVEYAPVTIGGRSYICPVRGVAFSKLRVRPDGTAMDRSVWPIHAFLNDVAFTQYHEFASEARIVASPVEGSGGDAAGSGGAAGLGNSASAGGPVASAGAAAGPGAGSAGPVATASVAAPTSGAAPASGTSATAETKTAEAAAPPANATAANAGAPVAPASTPSSPAVVVPVLASAPDDQAKLKPDLKVSSHLVVVDVVVRKGNHTVSGLRQGDFVVYEDGVPQTIRNFAPHFADEQADAGGGGDQAPGGAPGQMPNLPPDTFTNLPVANVTDSVTVLLLDGLNTAPGDVQYVRREMISYLKKSPPNRRIAIFALGQSLRMLQGFTTDTSQLMATLAKADATSPASLLPPGEERIDEAAEIADMTAAGMPGMDVRNAKNWMAESDASQTQMRAEMTLDAMEQLSRYVGGVSGRKNLVWFSGSFPLQFFAVTQSPLGDTSISATADFNEQVKEAADMLAAARVAVYPVDARGVLLQPMFAANQTTSATTTTRRDFSLSPTSLANGGPQGGTFGSDAQLAPGQRSAEHSSLDIIAQETGGRAVYDSNGLQQAMADALSDGSNFYTLAYVPTNTNYNGAQRNLQVRLAHGKADLFYRRSYYADASTPTENGAGNGAGQSSREVFLASMERGVPASSQIVFDVRAKATDQGASSGAIAGVVAGAISAMKDRAARYVIDYAANLATINLTVNANGVRQGHVDAVAIAYDRDGKILNWAGNKEPIALDQAAWDQSSRSGLQIHQVLDLPAGDVFLRVGLYDPNSGRFGSMEIPLHIPASK